MTAGILHLIAEADWENFQQAGSWSPPSLAAEGFVHCTADDTLLLRVANTFYRDQPGDFVVLTLDPDRLDAPVVWELPPDADPLTGNRFPHVYGPLPLRAVAQVRRAGRNDDGTFTGYSASD